MVEARIGRYRIEGTLGRGGMGEVHRAFDEELGRWVAIKTVHLGVALSAERLEQEARALAALNHPAIASIYDLVREGRDLYLVLELVEGQSLARVVDQGCMALRPALRVAADVASGLEAAHGRGIVHRDLKPENVIVTPEGRAKILDFGLATVLGGNGPAGEPGAGALAGTVSAMSPEQVERRAVDFRSDLFSFGTLLYQVLTGAHPFRSSLPVETMQRIVGEDPPPVRQLVPDLPVEVAQLVGRLLAKDPTERPASAAEVAVLLEQVLAAAEAAEGATAPARVRRRWWLAVAGAALAVGGVVGWLFWSRRAPAPLHVAVLRSVLEGAAAGDRPPLAVEAVRAAAVSALAGLDRVFPIAAQEVDGVPGSAAEVARGVAADEVLTAVVRLGGGTCAVTLSRLGGDGRTSLWMVHFEVPDDDVRLIAETVAANLRRAYPERRVRHGFDVAASPEAYAAFLRVRADVLDPPADVSWVSVLDRLEEVRRQAPGLLDNLTVEASVARYLFESTRDERYRKRAEALVAEAQRRAPDDPRTLRATVEVALATGDLEPAHKAVDRLQKLDPASPVALSLRAFLAQREGRGQEALKLQRRITARRPSWWNLLSLARLERSEGTVERARPCLLEATARAPSNVLVKAEVAYVETYSGDPERAVDLYLEVVAVSPQPQYLSDLGAVQLLLGRPREALPVLERAVAAGSRSPSTLLNLADCHSLLGESEIAHGLYEEAVNALERRGSDLSAKELGMKAECLAQLGRAREARAALAAAVGQGRVTSDVYFDAAVAEALLGDLVAAERWSHKALAAGVSPRYFDLPWFAAVRPRLGIGAGDGTSRPGR